VWPLTDRPDVSPARALSSCAQDIELCATAIRHAGDRIAPAYRFALSLLGGIRRWTFLPTLVAAAPVLVLIKGGDALSVCFNTVAVLFLCEIDNLLYAILLPERERARVEVEGRVELAEAEAAALMRSKAVHVAVLVVAVPCAVVGGGSGDLASYLLAFSLPLLAFWVAGATEAVQGSAGAGEACKEVGKVTGRWLLGMVGVIVLYALSLS
jgi:hypothetical protein